jgi:hypothetical protein
MSPAAVTRRAGGWLGDRLRRRHRVRRASDRRLARNVAERRRPKRLEASRRLAPRPSVRPAAAAAPVAAAGLSDFAARWMFGDGVAEGTPFAGGAASDYERPSFLDSSEEPAFQARASIPPGAEPRSAVEEVGPRFRLSRTPPPPPAPAPAPEPPQAPDPAHDEAVRQNVAAESAHVEPGGARPVIRVVHRPGPPRRSQVIVRHVHEGAREAAEGGGKGAAAYRTARVGIGAARLVQHYEEVKAVEALGHRVADAARSEWSKLKNDASEWRDKAVHEWDHLKHEGDELRKRAWGEAHHLEREGRGLERKAFGEAHHLEREGRGLERKAFEEADRLRRMPGQLLHQAEGAERRLIRTAVRAVERQPIVRAAEGLVRSATRGIKGVERLEHSALQAEHRLEGALKDPAKELRRLGEKVEKQVMDRPVVRRAESALQAAERTAARDARQLPHDVPPIPGAAAAKAAALAAAAEVPLEVSRAGRAVVQFEKQAAGAAHKLEAEARHAIAHADGHIPHVLPHEPHLGGLPATVAGRAATAAQHAASAARTPEDIAADHVYENVVERLRRDLLAERERMGNLLGEWP